MTENELIDRATTAYLRWCKRQGFVELSLSAQNQPRLSA